MTQPAELHLIEAFDLEVPLLAFVQLLGRHVIELEVLAVGRTLEEEELGDLGLAEEVTRNVAKLLWSVPIHEIYFALR